MAIAANIMQFLEEKGLRFDTTSHKEAYTSADEARAMNINPGHVAKTLVVRTRNGEALAVLPAAWRMDMHKLHDAVGDNHARLATEDEMGAEFTQFELGAVPPLGDMFGLPVYLDERLEQADEVVFAGGTHRDSVRMSGAEFLKLTHPVVVDLVKVEAEMLY